MSCSSPPSPLGPRMACLAAILLLRAAACAPGSDADAERARAFLAVVAIEDARPEPEAAAAALGDHVAAPDPFQRQMAVRALGRLEHPELVGDIAGLLGDPAAAVRAEAANALAQAVHGASGDEAFEALVPAVAGEEDPEVAGALARSLGRLAVGPGQRDAVAGLLVSISRGGDVSAPLATLTGVVLGMEALLRSSPESDYGGRLVERLTELSSYGVGRSPATGSAADAGRIRAAAVTALGQVDRLPSEALGRALRDPEARVRVAAARFAPASLGAGSEGPMEGPLRDASFRVRIEAVQRLARAPRNLASCQALMDAAAADAHPGVRVLAIDALAVPCPAGQAQADILLAAAAALEPGADVAWRVPAHAIVSLTRIDSAAAAPLLPRFVAHPNPFVRAYAASAAGALGDAEALEALARDPEPNVRVGAIERLFAARGHDIDELLLQQLQAEDPQLLLVTAGLLEGSPLSDRVAAEALEAFERASAARWETWRDPRRALLGRIAEAGDASMAERLTPYLQDYDAEVAADVATILEAWTGQPHEPSPRPLARAPLPSAAELAELERTVVALHMRDGGQIVIRLLPYLAPTNAFRFARLARGGYFDGLTFHRWAPNFVIQGGSPGANEYAGDSLFSRDEVGRAPHWRGTVGVSTRGRDTGDAQIFINLEDNVRLDHDYTVLGFVESGMDVVDGVLEGAVIERAEVRTGG